MRVDVYPCVCVHPCLQGEVEADALAAGLARLSGPNLQRREREREERGRKQIGVRVCLPSCDMLQFELTITKSSWQSQTKYSSSQLNNLSHFETQIESLMCRTGGQLKCASL